MQAKQSPRKLARAAKDLEYRVDMKEFSTILKDMASRFEALAFLNALLLNPQSKGLDLHYQGTGEPEDDEGDRTITSKDVKAANASFVRMLMDLKNYLRVSKKKLREHVSPDTFTGTYTPAYAGEALKYFFNNGDFGPADPKSSGKKLMDSLEYVKKGYLLRNTTTMLFYIYTHHNKLQVPGQGQFTKPDKLFKHAFGGKIPATYYVTKTDQGKQLKMLMKRAVMKEEDGGLDDVKKPMNTFEVIANGAEENRFHADKFNVYFYQNIAAANYFSVAGLDDAIFLAEDISDDESVKLYSSIKQNLGDTTEGSFRDKMLAEHNIVKETSLAWKEYRKLLAAEPVQVEEKKTSPPRNKRK